MAEAKPQFLYSIRADNSALKQAAADAGVTIKFDREVGAYELKTDGMTKGQVTEAKKALAPYIGKEAKAAWQTDRDAGLAEKNMVRDAVRQREGTTKEQAPARAPVTEEHRYLMFPAHSQKDEFRTLVRETGAQSRFVSGKEPSEAHYSVKTEVPERFAAFMGDAAKERFFSEHAERGSKPAAINANLEIGRDEAARRAANGFMAQYKERGFRLGDPDRDRASHQKQLNDMRVATTPQLLAVIRTSRDLLEPLREKEAQMRAEAAGLSVDQVKAMSFADQQKVGQVDGKPVGLTGEDFLLNLQLSRGIKAINAELEGRGVRQRSADRSQERGQTNDHGQRNEPQAHKVSQEKSVDDDYALAAAAFGRGRGRGR